MNLNKPTYDSVYIIDDDAVITMLHTMILKKTEISAEIKTFCNPSLALEQLRDDLFDQNKSVLVLLDINMPEMSGFEFLESTRLFEYSDFKLDIFMITSSIDPLDCRRGLQHPLVRKCIPKPFKGQDLIEFIESYGTVSA